MTGPTYIPFQVFPRLPERLNALTELAYNLHWSWDPDIIALFRRVDSEGWEATMHNPVLMLGRIKQDRIEALARDASFLSHMDRALRRCREYLTNKGWYRTTYGLPATAQPHIAYFSMEFGITECIANYSGGLGVLSGDHLKSSSDMSVPLAGVGLLYQQGYFRQYLNADGWQQETYPDNDFFNMPMTLERTADGAPLKIGVDLTGRAAFAQVWRVQVGNTPLYLLDANVEENAPQDRIITQQLYGGDSETRVRQEILLGIGGIRALDAVGIRPDVCHLNEGHSAFLALERIRLMMHDTSCSFAEALATTRAGNVFTTHTPVPAGIDLFDRQMMERYFGEYVRGLGISMNDLMRLGRAENESDKAPFNMALFAIHTSNYCNGVSALHGCVARKMWMYNWPGVPEDDIPIGHVTNGVHVDSYVSRDMADLFERYLGEDWQSEVADKDAWQRIREMPDEELWRTHERRRERLVSFVRSSLAQQYRRRGLPDKEIGQAREVLLPSALTLGFARRFATYKRATLLLRDKDRLRALLTNADRPVQIIFAGKAHPHDNGGKQLIRELVHFAQQPDVRQRIVFIEDYDLTVARSLVQGVDVWVNTPRRPLEASGTSGMKVVANGGLNLSILDGWWAEGYCREVGWAIGKGEEYSDPEVQDTIESEEFFNILEREVVPTFYDRGSDRLPREWIAKMKASMALLCPVFNTDRMVQEYVQKYYVPAQKTFARLADRSAQRGRELTAWCARMRAQWAGVKIEQVEARTGDKLVVGQTIPVQALVRLGELTPDDISVDLYLGVMNAERKIVKGTPVAMNPVAVAGEGLQRYEGSFRCETSGQHGFTVRVLPRHPDLENPHSLKLIGWW